MGFSQNKAGLKTAAIVIAGLILLWAAGIAVTAERHREGSITDRPATPKGIEYFLSNIKKDRYVWFEVNSEGYVNDFLVHARQWRKAGRLIVTTRLDNSEAIIRKLVHRGLDVTGGFKTSDAFKAVPFHDEKAWEHIAETARRVSNLCKGNPVVLENEGAVTMMVENGVTSVDSGRLLAAIAKQKWPDIWFWYAPMGEKEPYRTLSYSIAETVRKGIPKARLIESSSAGYQGSTKNKRSQLDLDRTLQLDSNPVSIVYLDDHARNFWKLKDAVIAVKQAFGNTVILYPGYKNIAKSRPVIDSLTKE